MFKLFFSFKYLNTHGVEFMVVKKRCCFMHQFLKHDLTYEMNKKRRLLCYICLEYNNKKFFIIIGMKEKRLVKHQPQEYVKIIPI